MKKILVTLILLFVIIIISGFALKINTESTVRELKNYNSEYEYYLNKKVYGVDLATLINKAVNLNEANNIEKDEKKHYIEDEENSIKIEIEMVVTKKTYPMEEIYNNNTAEFVKYFNLNAKM